MKSPTPVEKNSMQTAIATPEPFVLRSASGLWVELLPHGGVRRIGCGDDVITLFVGQACENPLTNLWLRADLHGPSQAALLHPLLGPASGGRWTSVSSTRAQFEGHHPAGVQWQVVLELADESPTWFWRVHLRQEGLRPLKVDLFHFQDVALCTYAAVRLNEYYVSQYIDFTPLVHETCGTVLAARQNQPVAGRHPWMVMGSLRRTASWSTDALQSHGWAARGAGSASGLVGGLPGRRLQHEHACIGLQDAPLTLEPGKALEAGFFGHYLAHHAPATDVQDLQVVGQVLQRAKESHRLHRHDPLPVDQPHAVSACAPSLFTRSPWLEVLPLEEADLNTLFGAPRAHEERGPQGELWSFFTEDASHVVLRAKELAVLRPHGHILRGGTQCTPDETALTSTVWMGGVFHSMLTQGHVSINRVLSTTRSYLGLFRSQGLRLFVKLDGQWQQLGTPSAFEMRPQACRWIYRLGTGLLVVRSAAEDAAMTLSVQALGGLPAMELRLTAHVALGGDDGAAHAPLSLDHDSGPTGRSRICLRPPAGSELHTRFPTGHVQLETPPASPWVEVGGDERLYDDSQSRGEPFLCMDAWAAPEFTLRITGHLVLAKSPRPSEPPASSSIQDAPFHCHWAKSSGVSEPWAQAVAQLQTFGPWLAHNAWVHFLAPRGLEQYSGGGWGTRDVCQGPLEMLLATGQVSSVRDLLLRTFAAQNIDGDWPQWFMFYDRDAHIRAGDSHGDIVFWPLLALARYLLATADAQLLDERIPFYGETTPQPLSVHVERALALIDARCIPGTHLAAYWHGDWNDSLQPADPALRERLCSAWTVTLHHQMLTTLARALSAVGQESRAQSLRSRATQVATDFQRHLVMDDVVTGYALFADAHVTSSPAQVTAPQPLIHPRDTLTGLKYSLLPMMHAVLEDLLDPDQAQRQVALMAEHLWGPDGARLFDAPMAYRGGPQQLFQRAESSSFFGREIGVMYMHAHLRYAQMLAHMGHASAFFQALMLAQPIQLSQRLPQAAPRQSNCYYSSSDAAFADRYEAMTGYHRIAQGDVVLEGGWRVYSSGPGIALHLMLCTWLGVSCTSSWVVLDPVMPQPLDGLEAQLQICGRPVLVNYRVGPAGYGVHAVILNGQSLGFEREPNRYRTGAAAVSKATFEAALVADGNRLELQLG